MEQEIHFVNNQKGHLTLITGNHKYSKKKTNTSGGTLWRCINRRECSASLTLDKTRTTITRKTRHTCESADIKYAIREHISSLKKIVCEDFRPIPQIFEEYQTNLHANRSDCLPAFRSIKDTLYRARKSFLNTDILQHNSTETASVPEVLGKNS